MSNIVDFIGSDSIAQLFDLHKTNNWRILRRGEQGNTIPVAEDIKSKSPAQGKNSFIEWARIILMGNPNNNKIYEIELFNYYEADETPEGSRKRTEKVRFLFQLNSGEEKYNTPYSPIQTDVNTAVENAVLKLKLEQAFEKMAELQARMQQLEEEEEEEEENGNTVGAIINAILAGQFKNNSAAMNGAPKEEAINQNKSEYATRLSAALKKLKANDNKFLLHIEKLANISENNPQMFKMLTSSLDSMSI